MKYLIIALLLLSPFASSLPDGLEFSVESLKGPGGLSLWSGVFQDYLVPGVSNEALSSVLAGLIGVGIIFILFWIPKLYLARKN